MTRYVFRLAAFMASATALIPSALANEGGPGSGGNFAISGGGGTTGVNGELQYRIADWVSVRGAVNTLSIDYDDTYDGVDYEGELELENAGLFVDLHPFNNSFMLTGGVYLGDKSISAIGLANGTIEIGGVDFSADQAGVLDLSAEMDDAAPFLGLGFDTVFHGSGHWGFKVVAGAMFAGEPQVTLTSRDGELSDDPALIAALEEEALIIERDIEDYQIIPVLQANLSFRF